MTVVKPKGWQCHGCSGGGDPVDQKPIQFQDEGLNLGGPGTVRILNFVGATVEAVRSDDTVTITISGSSGGSDFYRGDFTMTTLYPAAGTGSGPAGAIQAGDQWRLIIGGSGEVTIGGVQYLDGQLIEAAIDTPGQTTSNWIRIIT